jgi:hypothetical protein
MSIGLISVDVRRFNLRLFQNLNYPNVRGSNLILLHYCNYSSKAYIPHRLKADGYIRLYRKQFFEQAES